jgi:hypothetical protein
MYKRFFICVFGFLLGGCASKPIFTITASTPSYVEINGEIVCKVTPCEITPAYYTFGPGICNTSASMPSNLVAFPIDKSKGFVQYKNIRATCNDIKTIYFDMEARGGVATVPQGQ